MKLKTSMVVTGLTLFALIASPASFAGTKAEINASADKALAHFYKFNPKDKELTDKAVGILVFGRVTKGGAGVAGEYGEGVLRVNGKTVVYYSVASASRGLTLGVAHHSEVILFMTREALDKFQKSEDWSVGADTSTTATCSSGRSTPWPRCSSVRAAPCRCSSTCTGRVCKR